MSALLLLLVLLLPAASFAYLLHGLVPLGRAMAGVAASICLLTLIAQFMLIFNLWSPLGGLILTALISAGIAVLAHLRRPIHVAEVEAAAKAGEDEDWLFAE